MDSKLAARALNLTDLNLNDYPRKDADSDKEIVFMGCYNCDYTRKAWPMIKDLLARVPAKFTYIHFPTKPETKYLMPYDYCVYKQDPEKYWSYVDRLYANPKELNASEAEVMKVITDLGLDTASISACVKAPETKTVTEKQYEDIQKTGIYGTPTVFVNGTPVVGPKPERVYRRLLNRTII